MFALRSVHHYVAMLHSGGIELPSHTHGGFLCVRVCVPCPHYVTPLLSH